MSLLCVLVGPEDPRNYVNLKLGGGPPEELPNDVNFCARGPRGLPKLFELEIGWGGGGPPEELPNDMNFCARGPRGPPKLCESEIGWEGNPPGGSKLC